MTPLPPRAPKMAAEEASFRTSKDSMSFISRLPKKSLSTTIPSTTMSGDELLVIDPVPLTRMVGSDPASPSVAWILTPEICPTRASSIRETAILSRFSLLTLEIAPVRFFLF